MRDRRLLTMSAMGLTVWAGLPGCADVAKKPVADEMSAETDGDCPKEITYEKVARPFLARYCLRCHSDNVAGNNALGAVHVLDTEADVRGAGRHVYDAVELETMPPSFRPADLPTPTSQERNALLEWLECSGAAE